MQSKIAHDVVLFGSAFAMFGYPIAKEIVLAIKDKIWK